MRRPPAVAAALALALVTSLAVRPRPLDAQTPPSPAASQTIDELKKTALKVFLDCDSCDLEYIKTEITFVNYVRDRLEAQVHVLISTQSTGGGGTEYTLTFIGQNDCKDAKDVQKYYSVQTDTADDVRRGLVKALKLGLMGFVARTPIAGRIAVDYAPPEKTAEARDRWKSWVFSLSGEGMFMGEESYKNRNVNGSFSANRVTPGSKLRLGLSVNEERQKYRIEDEAGVSTITGTSSSWDASGLYVKSLGEHWSAGAFLEAESSFYNNIDLGLSFAPAVEYNFFRYSQSTRRQLRALYTLTLKPVRYRDETVFGKMRETLLKQDLSLTLDLREKFGTISVSAEGSDYLSALDRYRIDTFGMINLRLYKGLSVYVLGGYSWLHDAQLSLRLREPTTEELLLRLVELPMNSNHFLAVGFQFQFGSIFTNVINPRFGSAGGSGMRIVMN
ncbi:MAG TPA: hypothetical protein VLN41_00205 [Candidatus Bathyarchaeia archaeon]|nr:hypothetical protein [Candidatus Bathyarchaeia archaeon]